MTTTPTSENMRQDDAASAAPEIQATPAAVVQPIYPTWPTSQPGPSRKLPSAQMRSINELRPEQLAEIGYDQATGEPAATK